MKPEITYIPIELLDPHPHNPRGPVDPATVQELADSIRANGILEPLIVVPVRSKGSQRKIDRYTVAIGHRRLAAAETADLDEVPAIVRDYSPLEQEEIMLVENLQREDLTLLQEAKAFKRLIDSGVIQMNIARKIGCSAARIQQRLAILRLPESVQKMFGGNDIPVTLAPLLLKIESIDRQERLAQMVAARRLSVPKLKEMIDKIVEAEATEKTVDRSRDKQTKPYKDPAKPYKDPAKPSVTYTRADAVKDLEIRNGQGLTYMELLVALDRVCETCGMKAHPEICAACPLPQLINNLVKTESHAKAA